MKIDRDVCRILDANINRSREGLRVCEDITRFFMNDPVLTRELKTVRHGISAIAQSSPKITRMLIESRNSAGDVGKTPALDIELSRQDLNDIFTANIQRAKESIRVLEEFFKLIDGKLSIRLSRFRFRTYTIEKKVLVKLKRLS